MHARRMRRESIGAREDSRSPRTDGDVQGLLLRRADAPVDTSVTAVAAAPRPAWGTAATNRAKALTCRLYLDMIEVAPYIMSQCIIAVTEAMMKP